ncbi:MAG: succinate dehydrogenase assembly factor 2 [Gammaproteobacteria bacterium]|nr:succinate dehydrogenase assembly factor 2 [Gammaproteobacteria bacterium]MDH5630561.1 succinate dehydrogenase assembly factor 2 [Gammaproteobacteria bacterium]
MFQFNYSTDMIIDKFHSVKDFMSDIALKNKLKWQCRRGMLELDVILIPFMDNHFDSLTIEQQQTLAALLEEADPDLYTWLMGYGKTDNAQLIEMINLIRDKTGLPLKA